MNSANPSSITFFYPSKIVGGAEFLYIRLAKYLVGQFGIKVHVFDYNNGFLRKSLLGSDVIMHDYTDNMPVVIDYPTTVITPFCHIFKLVKFNKKVNSVKVLLWSIHPTHFTNYLITRSWFVTSIKTKKLAELFTNMLNEGSMVYMDQPNFLENKVKLGLSQHVSDLDYLPICCDDYYGQLKKDSSRGTINICWLGRLAFDKVSAIEHVIYHLDKLEEPLRSKIKFIVIGDGEEENRLRTFIPSYSIPVEFVGTITGDPLNEFILEHVDAGVAMGTSLLEFAKLKVPVFMVDIMPSNQLVDSYKFKWLNEAEGYSMGEIFSADTIAKGHAMKEIVETIANASANARKGQDCLSYYQVNHSLKSVAEGLIKHVKKAEVEIDSPYLKTINQIMNPWYFSLLKKMKSVISQ